jgi:hypothetical protein
MRSLGPCPPRADILNDTAQTKSDAIRFPVLAFHIKQTFPENWSEGLNARATPRASLALDNEAMCAIGGMTPEFRETMGYDDSIALPAPLVDEIEATMQRFPMGVMPRIGYCSWKAATLVHAPCFGLRGVMAHILQPDPRVADALARHITEDSEAVLHLREWRTIPQALEFRAFIQSKTCLGVSQYHHDMFFPSLVDNQASVDSAAMGFVKEIIPHLHMEDVVADFFLHPETGAGELIELNPFDRDTDPCLFSWDDPMAWDGAFKIVDRPSHPAT